MYNPPRPRPPVRSDSRRDTDDEAYQNGRAVLVFENGEARYIRQDKTLYLGRPSERRY
jgi:hypothetical protein